MVNKDQIEQWVSQGMVTREQADKMIVDVSKSKKEESSNNFIVTLSTVGSVCLGIGAILFVSSNWDYMSNFIKIAILLGSTFGALYAGYFLKYQKGNFPKVGSSLIFLGTLLFGATIFMISQMYNVNANSHTLILIWMLGVLPFVYVFLSPSITVLTVTLFYVWAGFFIFRGMGFDESFHDFLYLPAIYLVLGIFIFGVGGFHYLKPAFNGIARIFRLAGVEIAMISLFLLTFRFFSGDIAERGFSYGAGGDVSSQFSLSFMIFLMLAAFLSFAGLYFNPSKSKTNSLENLFAVGLSLAAMTFFYFPLQSDIFTFMFNLMLAGIIAALFYVGYSKADVKLVGIGMFWLEIFILARYFDFFWDLLPRSMFFIFAGIILVVGGVALEKKRGQLKNKFTAKPAVS